MEKIVKGKSVKVCFGAYDDCYSILTPIAIDEGDDEKGYFIKFSYGDGRVESFGRYDADEIDFNSFKN